MLTIKFLPGRLAFLFFILLYVATVGTPAEAGEKPSIIMLLNSKSTIADAESIQVVDDVNRVFADSGALSPIAVTPNRIFWSSKVKAASFSQDMEADYMMFMALSKVGKKYSYDAELVEPWKKYTIASYTDSWVYKPLETKKVTLNLASRVIFKTTSKITVNITIEASPFYCDVYRDEGKLGNTDKDEGFRKTLFWNQGNYNIILRKPKYKDDSHPLEVKSNPTIHYKKVTLQKR